MSRIEWTFGMTLDEAEKQIIRAAVRALNGNVPVAAVSLGRSEKTIRTKLAGYEKDEADRQKNSIDRKFEERKTNARMQGPMINGIPNHGFTQAPVLPDNSKEYAEAIDERIRAIAEIARGSRTEPELPKAKRG